MKNIIILFLSCFSAVAGFSQILPFPYGGVLPGRTNLDVRWKATKHPWPKALWTYQMVPTKFSPNLISNLMSLADFTQKDQYGASTTNGIAYYNYKNRLSISFATGDIDLDRELRRYTPTNLAEGVPGTNQLYQLAKDFIPRLGIDITEIPRTKKGGFKITSSEPSHTQYFLGEITITNIQFRRASFGRLIDGVECEPFVGSCAIDFGEHSQIKALSLHWRSVQRDKRYPAATSEQIVRWIRDGNMLLPKAIYITGEDTAPIDWSVAKRITIEEATAHYWGEPFFGDHEDRPIFPRPVVPYGILTTTVDMGSTKLKVKIVCPIIDESKPLN
jgi:hypothetical protein